MPVMLLFSRKCLAYRNMIYFLFQRKILFKNTKGFSYLYLLQSLILTKAYKPNLSLLFTCIEILLKFERETINLDINRKANLLCILEKYFVKKNINNKIKYMMYCTYTKIVCNCCQGCR